MITGFYGWGNAGDEGILQAIMDELGDNEYVVSTTLPFTMLNSYNHRILAEVRTIDDRRIDYDVYLLGGGGLGWGFGWGQALSAFSSHKRCMNYAVGYGKHDPKLAGLYKAFLEQFDALTVRDEDSQFVLEALGVHAPLTMCPAINLKEEKFECAKNMIAVCPRYEDSDALGNPGDNTPQIDWIVSWLKDAGLDDEVLLIPFSARDGEGNLRDLAVCREITHKLKGATILPVDGYSPRKIKYAISQSKLVISGGRYHALVWAAAHKIPYELSPTTKLPKGQRFMAMHKKYGDKLKEMEKKNVEIFKRVAHG